MKSALYSLLILTCIALSPLAAQESGGGDSASTGYSSFATTGGGASGGLSSKYTIRPQDSLHIKVFNEPDLSNEVRVEADGTIELALIGKVYVGGTTIAEAQSLVRSLYADGYLVNPYVTIQVLDYKIEKVNVLGQVNKPGYVAIPPEEPLTLLQAIAAAGGFTRLADEQDVIIRRKDEEGNTQVIPQNVREIQRNPNVPDMQLQDGDTISVKESII